MRAMKPSLILHGGAGAMRTMNEGREAAYRQALRDGEVDEDERVVLFNCATGLKYPMPEAPAWLDRHGAINLGAL